MNTLQESLKRIMGGVKESEGVPATLKVDLILTPEDAEPNTLICPAEASREWKKGNKGVYNADTGDFEMEDGYSLSITKQDAKNWLSFP